MATSYSKHGFNDLTYAHLKEYTSSSAVTLKLIHGYVAKLLQGWATGRNMFVTLRDAAGNLEVCKITAIQGHNLTVSRGQDGTIAQNWPAGTLIAQRSVSESLGRVIQKGEYRTIGYNPNAVLTGAYPGEKVYESGGDACQKRWWLFNEATKWRLLAGEKCGWEYYDGDGYVLAPTFWEPWSGPSVCTYNTWNFGHYCTHFSYDQSCDITGDLAGIWTLTGGDLLFDYTNPYADTVVNSLIYATLSVPSATTMILAVSSTLTDATPPGSSGPRLYVKLFHGGGSTLFTIDYINNYSGNYIGQGILEVDLTSYGVTGTVYEVHIQTEIPKNSARAEYTLNYFGIF